MTSPFPKPRNDPQTSGKDSDVTPVRQMTTNHFRTRKIFSFAQDERRKRNEQSRMIQVARSALAEELRGQTCIPAAVLQLQLTSIRPPLAPLPNRFLLSRHATPTNYGGLTQNRLNCDLKLRFIFLCVSMRVRVCGVCVCGRGSGGCRMFDQMNGGAPGAFQSPVLPLWCQLVVSIYYVSHLK